MLLAIEQGNTNTLFAVHDGQTWIAQWRAATHSTRTADEYAVWLSQLLSMAGLAMGAFDGCIISSVVPQSIFNLRNLARRYLHVEPMVIGENVDLGIEVRIEKPSEAGADRLVNAIGAHIVYPGDLIVIDSGTATTFDVVAAVLDEPLPDSAFKYREWWANQANTANRPQAAAWLDAGFTVSGVHQEPAAGWVEFDRQPHEA